MNAVREVRDSISDLMGRISLSNREVAQKAWANAVTQFRKDFPDAAKVTVIDFAEEKFWRACLVPDSKGRSFQGHEKELQSKARFLLVSEALLFNEYAGGDKR